MTKYFDEFNVGDTFHAAPMTLEAPDMIAFAEKYDPQPFHVDPEAGRRSIYGGLIASGFQTTAIAFGQFARLGLIEDSSMGGPGLDDVRWPAPVRAGDKLTVSVTVLEARPSRRKPDRGVLRFGFRVINQDDVEVCTFRTISIVARGPATASDR